MKSPIPPRWLAVGVFVLSSSLSFLDRQILAALAPAVRAEFRLSNEDYGWVLAAFSLAYALMSPVMGMFIDKAGLNLGISVSMAFWSLAGMSTALVNGFAGLLTCRAALGAAESGGVPATSKASALYLKPEERALGAAVNQAGISIGLVAAPLFAGWIAAHYGWRSAFAAAGALGFVWIPLWLATSRRVGPVKTEGGAKAGLLDLAGDRRLWWLMAANVLAMTPYSLWLNWTTLFLVEHFAMPQAVANRRLAWIPPLFAALGGLAGGWLSLAWARRGVRLHAARVRASLVAALFLLATAAAPMLPSAGWATAAVCLSFFWTVALSVNVYALPLDIFGAGRAASAIGALTFAYGIMQTAVSPLFGRLIDMSGFGPVCGLVSALPLISVGMLKLTDRRE